MAGILDGDSSCGTHNALRNITNYACGVSFSFKSNGFTGFEDGYAVVSLQECCDKVNASVLRIPGNIACEMQFCEVPQATTSYTETINYTYATGTGTAAQTPAPLVTSDARIGPPGDVQSCMQFVYEGDLPDDVAAGVANVGSWCIARNYDTDSDEDSTAVTANSAPGSWTSAAVNPWATWLASKSAASASAATATSDGISSRSKSQRSVLALFIGYIVLKGISL